MIQGTIFNIKKYALHDGPGIRTTVFMKGCPLSCWWCHNPEGIGPAPERISRTSGLQGRRIETKTEVIGRIVSVAEVVTEIEKDVVFYDESGGGVTFSGGEPLSQATFLKAMLDRCRKRGIHSAVDTSGHAPPEVFLSIMAAADLFLYDLKVMDPDLHVYLTGASNQWILRNLRTLSGEKKPTLIRFPAIPGLTDTSKNVHAVARFLKEHTIFRGISVLPYHRTAKGKYRTLEKTDPMSEVQTPDALETERIKEQFEAYGFTVTVGG